MGCHGAQENRSVSFDVALPEFLRPGTLGNSIITQRRGQRRYRFRAEGEPIRTGRQTRRPELLRWMSEEKQAAWDQAWSVHQTRFRGDPDAHPVNCP